MHETRVVKGSNHIGLRRKSKNLCIISSEMAIGRFWAEDGYDCIMFSKAHSSYRGARLEAGKPIRRLLQWSRQDMMMTGITM